MHRCGRAAGFAEFGSVEAGADGTLFGQVRAEARTEAGDGEHTEVRAEAHSQKHTEAREQEHTEARARVQASVGVAYAARTAFDQRLSRAQARQRGRALGAACSFV